MGSTSARSEPGWIAGAGTLRGGRTAQSYRSVGDGHYHHTTATSTVGAVGGCQRLPPRGWVTVNVDARACRAAAAVLAVRPDPQADVGFVGRGRELDELLTLLTPISSPGRRERGRRGREGCWRWPARRGWEDRAGPGRRPRCGRPGLVPGWAVSVDLHGYGPDPAAVAWPAQLHAGLLRALDVPGELDQAIVDHQLLDQLAVAGWGCCSCWTTSATPTR